MTDDFSCSKKGSPWQTVRDGLMGAWPICLGYFPIGMALVWRDAACLKKVAISTRKMATGCHQEEKPF